MAFMFENLKVYQLALDFADQILDQTAQFPKGYYFLADQLNRASTSIPTNIAEGNGRFNKADRKHFFMIARGSDHECIPLLELACRKKLVNTQRLKQFRQDIEEIAKMLAGLINGVENRKP